MKVEEYYLKLENGQAEKILANFLEEALKEGDIDGKTVNEANLERLVKARMLATKFFEGVEDVEIELTPASRIHSTTMTNITCPRIEFERGKDGSSEKAALLQELISMVDDFEASALSGRQVFIQFGIDGVWEE